MGASREPGRWSCPRYFYAISSDVGCLCVQVPSSLTVVVHQCGRGPVLLHYGRKLNLARQQKQFPHALEGGDKMAPSIFICMPSILIPT